MFDKQRNWLWATTAVMAWLGIALFCLAFTRHENKPRLLRYVTTSDTDLTAATKNWTTAADANYFIPIQDDWDKITSYVVFYNSTGDVNAAACVLHYYGTNYWGGIQDLYDVNVQAGNVSLTHNPLTGTPYNSGAIDPNRSWGDAFTNTGAKSWIAPPFIVSGTDIIGSFTLDTLHLHNLGVKVTGVENATSVSVIFVGLP